MPVMQTSDLTPRQYWEEVKANPNRAKFGFGEKAAIINIDCQRAYTDMDNFKTAINVLRYCSDCCVTVHNGRLSFCHNYYFLTLSFSKL